MKVREILKAKGASVVTARPDELVRSLVQRFRAERIGAVVVVGPAGAPVGLVSERDVVYGLALHGERKLVGIVSIGDVVKHRLDEIELEAKVLRDYVITSH
jgi:CBS domain-containing protein